MESSNQNLKNAMTVDVEDYFHVAAFSQTINPSRWGEMQSRVERNTQVILDLFEKSGIKATFFVLGWVAERYPGIVQHIHQNGHEVACHGYSHQLIYKQDPRIYRDETKKARDILEDITNSAVAGYRAASYSITRQSLWALDVLTELGFKYDSSIVPVHHDLYGIPDMPRNPHTLKAPNGKEIIEFPPSTLSLPRFNLPVAGGGYFRLYPFWFTRMALKWVNRRDDMPFIFYLHPWEIDPDQPRMEGSWFSRFRHYNNLSKCHKRMENLLDSFEFTTVGNVLRELNLIANDAPSIKQAVVTS